MTVVDELLDVLADRIEWAQRRYPLTPYAGRLYYCPACESIDACCAPVADLADDYACPTCDGPQLALTDPGQPRRPDRAQAYHGHRV